MDAAQKPICKRVSDESSYQSALIVQKKGTMLFGAMNFIRSY